MCAKSTTAQSSILHSFVVIIQGSSETLIFYGVTWSFHFSVSLLISVFTWTERPFSSASRWFLDAVGHPRSSRGFIINGYLMGVSFFLCRILIMPIYYYKCYSVWGTSEQRDLGILVNFFWIFTCIVLDTINLYWFVKIVKGAIKLTRKLKDRKE